MEALGAASSLLSIAVLAKDITQLAFTFQDSLKEISGNRKEHVGLVNRIINCMESLIHAPSTQVVPPALEQNIITLRGDLRAVLKRCSELRSPKNGMKAWVLREHVSKAIDKLKRDFEVCLQIFNAMSTFRLEHRLSELHNKVDILVAKLEDRLVKGDSDAEMAHALVRTKSMDRRTLQRGLRRAKKSLIGLRSQSMEERYLKIKIKTVNAALVYTQDVKSSHMSSNSPQSSEPEDLFLDALELLRALRKPKPTLPADVIAIRLDNLSVILSDTGDYEGASFVSIESVKLLRSLDLLSTRHILATALHNRANHLRNINIHDALASSNEAVMLFEDLHNEDSHRYLPSLSMAQNTLANCHQKVGNHEKAIRMARAVVGIQRQLYEEDPERFELDLAMSLNNLAVKLRQTDCREARNITREACDLFRHRTPQTLEANYPEFAATLTNYSTCLLALGEYDDALIHIREALSIRHALCRIKPHVYAPQLAESCLSAFKVLILLHRDQDADVSLNAAIESYRKVVNDYPGRHHRSFALFLRDAARSLLPLRRYYEALSLLQEGLPMFAEMAGDSANHISGYVSVLDDLASCSRHLNMMEDADTWSRYADTGRLCMKLLSD